MEQNQQDYQKDLASIRDLMERSIKFISLSGLSGILAGIYALAGATAAYYIIHVPTSPTGRVESFQKEDALFKLLAIAMLVLVASIATGIWLSQRKAKQHGTTIWNPTSKRILINMLIPLVTGGFFIVIMLFNGHYGLVAPACLIFYGLALISASDNLFEEIRYLGYSEIVLGIVCTALPGYGLLFWSFGFGVFHIFYGALMFRKYDQ